VRVVIIDDNSDTRLLIRAYLESELPASVRVRSYSDAAYREATIRWEDVAVAVVDIMMPVVDGRVLLAELRDEHPNIYRVAWTASPDVYGRGVVEEGLAHALVPKPGLDELRALIAKVR
jgi:CheY-like chemotaxis protein